MKTFGVLILALLVAGPAWAQEPDTDGDGLSDFHERHKYFTDPAKEDSDGDGTPDGGWDERREYSYTIRSVVRVMRPVDDSALADDYQDARVLEETPTWVKLEVIHYPFNTVSEAIQGDPDWRRTARRMEAHRAPGPTSNWDGAMRKAILDGLGKAGIDAEALDDRALVERAAAWLLDHARYDGSQFTGYFTHFPEGHPAICPGCEAGLDQYNHADRSIEAQWARDLLARDMFAHGTRGSCTSTAIYLNAGLRAIGVPTRIVYCIPVLDASDPDEMAMLGGLRHPAVRRVLDEALSRIQGSWSGHTFNEVFVGGRWRRLNYKVLGQNTFGPQVFGLLTHVLTVNDWAEADAARTIGVRQAQNRTDDVFGHQNPYSTVELSDRFGIHATTGVEPRAGVAWQTLTIERAIWYFSPDRPPSLTTKISDPSRAGYVLLQVQENETNAGLAQYRPFWSEADKAFLLKAAGQDDLHATATRGYWGSGWFFLEIPRADLERMAKGVSYTLVPANAQGTSRWAVAEGVRLVRSDETAAQPVVRTTTARTVDALAWSDQPEGRQVTGPSGPERLAVLARIEAYDGDFDALKRHQSGGSSTFHVVADGHPTLAAEMATGGITTAGGEAWAILLVVGGPRTGVTYRLRAPDARWVIRGALPPR